MQLRQLGKSGLLVSEICLGTMTFGGQTSAWEARQIMDHYIGQSGNFFDTANAYQNGASEEIIGQWIKDNKHRPYVIIGTKTFLPEGGDPNHRRLSRHAILHSVEQSLSRLKTDYIDIYYTHYWDEFTPIEETLYTLEQLVQQGKVRYVACSNYLSWQIMKALTIQQQNNWLPFVCFQAQYNLIERGIERETISLLESEQLALLAWSPLGGGFLTGKFSPTKSFPPKTRLADESTLLSRFYRDLALNDRGWLILDEVIRIAEKYRVPPAQVALAWVLYKPFVTSVIMGASKVEHLDLNLGVRALQLQDEDILSLDDISVFDLGYPGYMPYFVRELF